jgi:TonB-linked SusC/RagA family outer membrane protein
MKIFSGILFSLFIGLNLSAQKAEIDNINESDISGRVISRKTNTPLEGIEIIVTGSNENYYTDSAGEFTFPFSGNEMWVLFNYPGFSPKELLFNKPGRYDITLSLLTEKSIDSKIPGYFGEIHKFKNNAHDYISSSQIISRSQVNPELLIQGRLSGVSATALSGLPGEGASINIRGLISLFGSQNPLIILDGMPYNYQIYENQVTPGTFHNSLKGIDVNEVQSIEVLKDGGSLYGIRGAGGLILITTTHPESVTTKINFSVHSGVTMQPANLPLLSADQHKTMLIHQLQNSGMTFSQILQENPWVTGNPSYYYYYNYSNETDWQDVIFKPASMTKFNVNLEGGDEIARFAVLLGYLNQKGVVENTGYQRYNFRLNSDIRILQKLSMISNVGFSYHVSDINNFGVDQTLNPITAALIKGPMYGPYLRDNLGNRISIFSDSDEFGFSNPAVLINKSLSSSLESNLFANLKLLYQPTNNFSISNTTNVSFDNIRDNAFIPDYGIVEFKLGELYNSSKEGAYKYFSVANEMKAELRRSFNDVHFIHTQGGIRLSTRNETYTQGSVFNTPTDEFKSLSSVSLVQNTYINGNVKRINNSDLFLYNGYRYRDKYLFDVVLTLSASSNTGKNAETIDLMGGKWGFFPSIHGAWIISSEPFLKSSKLIDLLKLRASYSVTGNDFFIAQHRYYYQSRTYDFYSGIIRTFIPNESLKWEQINQINVGLDLHMFNETIGFGIDVYNRTTSDLLVFREVPDISGFRVIWENNGSMNTRGVDLNAEFIPIRGTFCLTLGGNLSIHRSKVSIDHDFILDVPGANVLIRDGEAPFSFYGLQSEGIYSSASEASMSGLVNDKGNSYQAGDVKFIEQNGDGVIDDSDRMMIGNMIPETRAGAFLTLTYKGFTLYTLVDYVGGNQLYNYTRRKLESFSGYGNQSTAAYYAWKNEEDLTELPRLAYGDPSGNAGFSDRWIENGAFFRIRELTISYDLPPTRAFKNLRIYITGLNLFTLSEYLGYYPEFLYSSNPAFQSIDYGQIPLTPQFLVGLNVGF